MGLHIEPGYEALAEMMQNALDQVQFGKGKERHANERTFRNQTLMNNIRAVGTGYSCGQAMKKAEELHSMVQREDYNSAIEECYGAAVYLLATALYLQGQKRSDAGQKTKKVMCGDMLYATKEDEKEKRPSLQNVIDWTDAWSKAPKWAEWALQVENGDVFFTEDDDSSPYGRVEMCKRQAPLAHDWQTPLRRSKKLCSICEGAALASVRCVGCGGTGKVNAE